MYTFHVQLNLYKYKILSNVNFQMDEKLFVIHLEIHIRQYFVFVQI